MNQVQLYGNITRTSVNQTSTGKTVMKFSLAVKRAYKTPDKDTDFINCVAFGKTADLIQKFFAKGSPILVNGSISTGSYVNKNNITIYTTDVNVDKVFFTSACKRPDDDNTVTTSNDTAEFLPDDDLSALPFDL